MTELTDELLLAKLDTVIKLLALAAAPEALSLKERALRLQKAGMSPKDIAALCDTTANTVSVALSAAKRAKKTSRRKT